MSEAPTDECHGARAGDDRQPRPRLRLSRADARPLERGRLRASSGDELVVTATGEGADRLATGRRQPRGAGACGGSAPKPARSRRTACASTARSACRSPRAWARARRPSSPGCWPATLSSAIPSTPTVCSALAAELEGHPDNVAAALGGGLVVVVRARRRPAHRALRPAADRRRPRRAAARVLDDRLAGRAARRTSRSRTPSTTWAARRWSSRRCVAAISSCSARRWTTACTRRGGSSTCPAAPGHGGRHRRRRRRGRRVGFGPEPDRLRRRRCVGRRHRPRRWSTNSLRPAFMPRPLTLQTTTSPATVAVSP